MLDDPRTGTPPQGDWLGTPYLRFERHGPLARCIVDRPKKRNAMTPAMYFGVRYAINHVDADPDLAGLLLTGTGDVFIPGGELRGPGRQRLPQFSLACHANSARCGIVPVITGTPSHRADLHRLPRRRQPESTTLFQQ